MTLPTFQGSISRIYPFAPKVGSKRGLIQNINFQYNVRGENRILTTDSLFFKKEMFESAKSGFQHSIPISTNFKLFKYLSFSTSANFKETWVFKTIDKKEQTLSGILSLKNVKWTTPIKKTIQEIHKIGDIIFVKKEKNFWSLKQYPKVNGGRIILDPFSVDVLALVGGFNFKTSEFNLVTQAKRQPG